MWARLRDSVDETPSFVMQVVAGASTVLYDETGQLVDDTKRMQVPMRMTFDKADDVWLLSRLEILAVILAVAVLVMALNRRLVRRRARSVPRRQ